MDRRSQGSVCKSLLHMNLKKFQMELQHGIFMNMVTSIGLLCRQPAFGNLSPLMLERLQEITIIPSTLSAGYSSILLFLVMTHQSKCPVPPPHHLPLPHLPHTSYSCSALSPTLSMLPMTHLLNHIHITILLFPLSFVTFLYFL